jgi:hypothetical protein
VTSRRIATRLKTKSCPFAVEPFNPRMKSRPIKKMAKPVGGDSRQWDTIFSCGPIAPLVGRRARIVRARLDTYRPSPCASGEWTDGAFPVLDPRAFIAQLKPSTNENSRTTRSTDGSSAKTTWKWGTRARQIGRQNTPAQETAPAALQLTAYRDEKTASAPAKRPSQVRSAFRSPGVGLLVGFQAAIVRVLPQGFHDPRRPCPAKICDFSTPWLSRSRSWSAR